MSDTQHLEDALFETLLPFYKQQWCFIQDSHSHIPHNVLDEALAAALIVAISLLDFGKEYGTEARNRVSERLDEAAPIQVYSHYKYRQRKAELEKEGFPFA